MPRRARNRAQFALEHGFEKRARALAGGLARFGASFGPIEVEGKTVTTSALLSLLRAVEERREEQRDALVAARQKLVALEAAVLAAEPWVRNLPTLIKLKFGASNAELVHFGIRPARRKRPSPETQLAASAQGKLTRAERHTMGARQRQAIRSTGQLRVVVLGADGQPIEKKRR